ncbi:alpha-(1,3)-fucosyltransferase fut-6-like isoform X2 [Haliotis rufescens]|uniref:alpha-(1,3)-fucosyltransferase fut-6-like isoform X2 n=1 Tax=Haliotis rufescens TaxID=6454 RepID=UPI00201E7B15|nr:alpha-(1,3)-fucosyltransferase fut-6-like isoform X2 [Haliotis rufescens]
MELWVGECMKCSSTPGKKTIIFLVVSVAGLLVSFMLGRKSMSPGVTKMAPMERKVNISTTAKMIIHLESADAVSGSAFTSDSLNSTSNVRSGFPRNTIRVEKNTTKLILWYLRPNYVVPTNEGELRPLKNCPDLNCRETTDVKLISRADAVVFDVHFKIRPDNKPIRYPEQTWVFFAQESPVHVKSRLYRMDKWKSSFNWTCTYRRDSDVWMPYGIILKNPKLTKKDYRKIAESKTKMAGWVVSHCSCESKREVFAKRLVEQGIQVDIFGDCGKKCGTRSKDGTETCEDLASSNYSFYLSFENSLCDDYITEKFFHMYNKDVILIARGGRQFLKSLPKGTFINTDDYKNVKDLAAYLKRLHENKNEYISFLKRKDEYMAVDETFTYKPTPTFIYTHSQYISEPMCDMCRKLLDIDNNRNTYPDIYQWYNENTCVEPTDL